MIYKRTQKEYFIYKEYDEFGYKEKIYITKVFETIGEMFEYMSDRKKFWHDNTRRIEIDLIHGIDKDSDKEKAEEN